MCVWVRRIEEKLGQEHGILKCILVSQGSLNCCHKCSLWCFILKNKSAWNYHSKKSERNKIYALAMAPQLALRLWYVQSACPLSSVISVYLLILVISYLHQLLYEFHIHHNVHIDVTKSSKTFIFSSSSGKYEPAS